MSNIPKNGGPAFPRPVSFSEEGGTHYGQAGMSLRDYFAAAALTGMITEHRGVTMSMAAGNMRPANLMTEQAYQIADSMIAARGRPE